MGLADLSSETQGDNVEAQGSVSWGAALGLKDQECRGSPGGSGLGVSTEWRWVERPGPLQVLGTGTQGFSNLVSL